MYSFFSEYHKQFSSRVMKTFKFSLVLRTREKNDVFITLDDNIYGIHRKKSKYPLCIPCKPQFYYIKVGFKGVNII